MSVRTASRPTTPAAQTFWPAPLVNPAAAPLIDQITFDKRRRTLPETIPGPDGVPQVFQNMTPLALTYEGAKKLLEYNTINRKLSPSTVDRLCNAHLSDEWLFNGQSCFVVFSNRELLNGQHTLESYVQACEEAAEKGITLPPILVIPIIGLDAPKTFATQDTVNPRKTRDMIFVAEKNGELVYSGVKPEATSNALRTILQFHNAVHDVPVGDPLYMRGLRDKIPNWRAAEMLRDSFPQLLESLQCCNDMTSFHQPSPVLSLADAAAVHAILSEVQSATAATNFVKSLVSGANLEEGSPIHKLREQLIADKNRNTRSDSLDRLAMCIQAWNLIAKHVEVAPTRRFRKAKRKDGTTEFPVPLPIQRRPSKTMTR